MKTISIYITLFLILFVNSNNFSQSADYYASEGLALFKKGKYYEAIAQYEKAIAINPRREWYYQIGNAYYRLNSFIKAGEIFVNAVNYSGSPHINVLYYDAACSYSRGGEIDNAYKYLILALDNGYANYDYALKDSDLENLRQQNPSVREKIMEYKNRSRENQPQPQQNRRQGRILG